MRISGTMTSPGQQVQQPAVANTEDAESNNIQNQIAAAQKQLQELSSNEDMSAEEKMKKRQEIQKQISDLNNQLRQHQMELKREEQQKREVQQKQAEASEQNAQSMTASGMQALITADASLEQARTQGSVAGNMKGRVGVLESEIKLDAGRGMTTDAKQEELDRVSRSAQNATSMQMSLLSEADQSMKAGQKKEDSDEADEKKQQEKTDVKMYSEDGKPVAEEPNSKIMVRV